jgi:hemolysin-activating ACP:hemolysin acyltransferase
MAVVVRTVRDPWMALGLAAHFVARRETFGRFSASELIRTLNAQITRKHFLFAFDTSTDPARVIGYFGWTLYDHTSAERFAATGKPPPGDLASGGDVLWILTSVAENKSAFFALVKATRALYPSHRVMAIRHKPGGKRVLLDQSRARVRAKGGGAQAALAFGATGAE